MVIRRRNGSEDIGNALDAMREGFQVIDRDFRYVEVNTAAAVHGRRSKEELIGRTMMECYPGIADTELFALLRKCMNERVSGTMESKFIYPDGASRIFEVRVEPTEIGIVVLSIDVTEGRQLESQLRHAQKMEAVGRLASGVGHDFNNIFAVISTYTALILSGLGENDPLRADVMEIKHAGERATELTRQLLTFSHQQVSEPGVLDLNAILKNLAPMVERLLGNDIALTLRPALGLGRIVADPGQVELALMNVIVNASDAMPDGGKLTIETSNVTLGDADARDHLGVQPGQYVMIAITDSGIGMSGETLARIFDPFFTTKKNSKRAGLGLATVFGIVKQSGGHVRAHSEVGNGTTFKMSFPRTAVAPGK